MGEALLVPLVFRYILDRHPVERVFGRGRVSFRGIAGQFFGIFVGSALVGVGILCH